MGIIVEREVAKYSGNRFFFYGRKGASSPSGANDIQNKNKIQEKNDDDPLTLQNLFI